MAVLTELSRAIDRLQAAGAMNASSHAIVSTDWPGIDDALGGGLTCGLHEWFGPAYGDVQLSPPGPWSPSLSLVIHLVRRALHTRETNVRAAWIGRRCFPYPALLSMGRNQGEGLLAGSLFIDAENPASRLWSIEQAIGSSVVRVVIADGSRFNMAATRRIQLRAHAQGVFVFLLRPPSELVELSAAQTRWLIRYERSAFVGRPLFVRPCWRVELWRCKGVRSLMERAVWVLERDRATRAVRLSAELVHPAIDDQTARQTA